ncbi:hypothetical protein TWF281_005600 [Arthrobotrys megalospora]
MYMSGQLRHAASRLLLYRLRAQKPLHRLQAQKPLHHHQQRSSLAKNSNLSPIPVPSLIVTELAKANIRCTNEGVKIFEEAYASMPESILYDPWDFSQCFDDALMASDIDFHGFYHLRESPKSPWRSNEQAFVICMNSKVYKMWEALYSSSTIFRGLIDQEEQYTESFPHKAYQVDESSLWNWMSMLIEEGVVNREDIENLPDPVNISKLELPV